MEQTLHVNHLVSEPELLTIFRDEQTEIERKVLTILLSLLGKYLPKAENAEQYVHGMGEKEIIQSETFLQHTSGEIDFGIITKCRPTVMKAGVTIFLRMKLRELSLTETEINIFNNFSSKLYFTQV
jgi:hypothetical protein